VGDYNPTNFEILLVIVIDIWQKLNNIEREATLIVTHFWQLFSRIFGETSLIVTHIWRNLHCFHKIRNDMTSSCAGCVNV
jgi:hypothetical protein